MKFVTNVPWEYSEIVPDYIMGKTSCALFLSIRYHQLNPDYIHERLKSLGNMFNLRVLLVQVQYNHDYVIQSSQEYIILTKRVYVGEPFRWTWQTLIMF